MKLFHIFPQHTDIFQQTSRNGQTTLWTPPGFQELIKGEGQMKYIIFNQWKQFPILITHRLYGIVFITVFLCWHVHGKKEFLFLIHTELRHHKSKKKEKPQTWRNMRTSNDSSGFFENIYIQLIVMYDIIFTFDSGKILWMNNQGNFYRYYLCNVQSL